MLVIQDKQVHQVAQVRWVTLVHQVLHCQVNEEKRVFLAQLVCFLVLSVVICFSLACSFRYSGSTRSSRCQRRTRYNSIIDYILKVSTVFICRSSCTTKSSVISWPTRRKRWSWFPRHSRITRLTSKFSFFFDEECSSLICIYFCKGSKWFTRFTRHTRNERWCRSTRSSRHSRSKRHYR